MLHFDHSHVDDDQSRWVLDRSATSDATNAY
ncbi:uncharacterized protein METZ01_LOCUS86341, partial [marine metagenome]